MQIEEKQVTLRKLVASEGMVLRSKIIEYDDEGNEIPRLTSKTIYLGINDSEENYEEIPEEIIEDNYEETEEITEDNYEEIPEEIPEEIVEEEQIEEIQSED